MTAKGDMRKLRQKLQAKGYRNFGTAKGQIPVSGLFKIVLDGVEVKDIQAGKKYEYVPARQVLVVNLEEIED